ncbi:hypothetical protein F5144DRAFT_644360 [Chaetomium tenue]|uniref:Uncharacterized protein n=1 Tax=Chaetomium tenue TaxID=1854479 RepID=A0ACB7PDA0_9PEZI|nr:hypothetical protein F5144DRAFT_644360 [Chaetomium globosum]
MDDLSDLELVGLVVSEVEIHLGIIDRNLADLIIAQRVASDTFQTFQQKVGSLTGNSLPTSLLETIDRLLRMMHPAMKPKEADMHHAPEKQRGVEQPHVRAQAYVEAQAQCRPALPDQTPSHDSINNTRKRGRSGSRSNDPDAQGNRRLRSDPYDQDRPRRTPYDADLDRLIMEDGQRRGRQGRDEDDRGQREYEVPVLNHIYEGHMAGVKTFGASVNLQVGSGNLTGLAHASQLADGLNHPSDLVARDQPVKVEIISMDGTRIGLSIKDVDQHTEATNTPTRDSKHPVPLTEHQRKMASPERLETRQVTAAGVVKASDFPGLEEHNATPEVDGGTRLEGDLEIRLRGEEPPFLIGQAKQSLELLPIRMVKTPDASMNRAALSGTVSAEEWAEIQHQRAAEAATKAAGKDQDSADLPMQCNDPMPDLEQPNILSHSLGGQVYAMLQLNLPNTFSPSHPKEKDKNAEQSHLHNPPGDRLTLLPPYTTWQQHTSPPPGTLSTPSLPALCTRPDTSVTSSPLSW